MCNLFAKPSLKIGSVNKAFLFWYWLQLKFFFRDKTFLYFKLESWNFQHLFKNKFCKTSQNFNSFLQTILFPFFPLVVWLSWNFVIKKFVFKQILTISAFYLVKQKSFIPKKMQFRPLSISKQKSFVYWPNFQRRFGFVHLLITKPNSV